MTRTLPTLVVLFSLLVLSSSCSTPSVTIESAARLAPELPPSSTTRMPPSTSVPSSPSTIPETTAAPGWSDTWNVVGVIDGDTIDVVKGPAVERLRLIGMNANESGECMADEATRALEVLVLNREVLLVADESDRDQYGRLLRYVWVDDTFVNAALVEQGLAIAREYPPDTAMHGVLSTAEALARNNGAGLWAPDACGPATISGLRILHVEADAPGDDNQNLNGEWVAIRNTAAEASLLTGWILKDESASHRYTFPDGFRLDAGASVQVFTGCGIDTIDELYWCEKGSAVWNNSGDTAFLLAPSGNTVDHWSY